MTLDEVQVAISRLPEPTRETLLWAIERGHLTWEDCQQHTAEEFPRWAQSVAGLPLNHG